MLQLRPLPPGQTDVVEPVPGWHSAVGYAFSNKGRAQFFKAAFQLTTTVMTGGLEVAGHDQYIRGESQQPAGQDCPTTTDAQSVVALTSTSPI
jgi:hypothetical protein